MTKLLEWLTVALVFLAVWAALITDTAFFQISDQIKEVFIPVSEYFRGEICDYAFLIPYTIHKYLVTY